MTMLAYALMHGLARHVQARPFTGTCAPSLPEVPPVWFPWFPRLFA